METTTTTRLTRLTVQLDNCISTARWELRHGGKRANLKAKINLNKAAYMLMQEMANGTNRQADASLTEAGKLLDILCGITSVA